MIAFSGRLIRAFGALLKLLSELLSSWGDGPPSPPPTGRPPSRPDSTGRTNGESRDIRRSPRDTRSTSIGSHLTLQGFLLPSSRGWVAFGKASAGRGAVTSRIQSTLTHGCCLKAAVEVGAGNRDVTPPDSHSEAPTGAATHGNGGGPFRGRFSTNASSPLAP